MFYGVPTDKVDKFYEALNLFYEVFGESCYANDMLLTIGRNCTWRHDTKLLESFEKHAKTDQEKSLIWRIHTLVWAAKSALHIEGDFVECGVFKGFCSGVVLDAIDFKNSNKQAYLYDTFEGLPPETSTEEERKNWDYTQYDTDAVLKEVYEKFDDYNNVTIVQGVVPKSFDKASPDKIAFLHIDMNSEQAEILALENLFERVSNGGYIIFDDYGWVANINQTTSEMEFMRNKNHNILELPTGQGLVIKQG